MLVPEVALEFERVLQKTLKSASAVIVEGKKDKSALEALGFASCRIILLNEKPLFAVAEEVAANYESVILLTDLDAEGMKLYGKLNTLLQQLGVRVDDRIRNFLFRSTNLRQIEGVGALFRELA